MRLLDQVLNHRAVGAGDLDGEGDIEAEALAIVAVADAHLAGDGGLRRNGDLGLARHGLQSAQKARRIPRRKELLRIRPGPAPAAELLRGGEWAIRGGAIRGGQADRRNFSGWF